MGSSGRGMDFVSPVLPYQVIKNNRTAQGSTRHRPMTSAPDTRWRSRVVIGVGEIVKSERFLPGDITLRLALGCCKIVLIWFPPFRPRSFIEVDMTPSPDSPLWFPYQCRDCGSDVGFRSRRRTFTERFLLPLLLLRPVRCGECFRRDYRLIFTRVRDRFSSVSRIAPISASSPPKRNVA